LSNFVYIMQNPAFPDRLKIGHATNVNARARQLSAPAGVPEPYEVIFYCKAPHHLPAPDLEYKLHQALKHGRVNPRKEHFNLLAEEIREAISRILNEEPEGQLPVWHPRIHDRMREAWKDARLKFWEETSQLRESVAIPDRPGEGTIRLDPNLPPEEKIAQLMNCVKAHSCHATAHVHTIRSDWTHAGLHIFTPSGVCFHCIDVAIAWDNFVGRRYHSHHRLPELCDALVRKERELYASIVTSPEG
jgi:hypothetical protein